MGDDNGWCDSGAPCTAQNRGGGPSLSMVVDSGVVWATRSLDLEVVAAFLRLVEIWNVPFINRAGSMRLGR